MKKLILMRHAKSDWSGNGDDHTRRLNSRGQRSAMALGDWLRARNHIPDQILCSTAARTRETLALLKVDGQMDYLPELYLADPQTLLSSVRDATGTCVLVIAHNPGIAEFASDMAATLCDHPKFGQYPTGATLVLDIPTETWETVGLASGDIADFVVPRDLA